MNKNELIKQIANHLGMEQKQIKSVFEEVIRSLQDELKAGGFVSIPGFGRFYITQAPRRQVKTPAGEVVEVGPCARAKFKASKKLKEYLN